MKVSEIQLLSSICRESFYDFTTTMWHTIIAEKFVPNWHIEFLCDEYQKMAERIFLGQDKLYDHVTNISPGTSKSSVASNFFPAWVWTRMQSFRFIGASYSYPIAMDLSRKCRDVVTSDLYKELFPEVQLRDDQNTKGYFGNTGGGYRYAIGINGSVTGLHGHWIGIDDPLDPNQAFSPTDLAASNRWIRETLSTRKVNKKVSVMALVMQRLNQDDPTALFLQRENCRHVCLDAELSDNIKPAYLKKFYKRGVMDPYRLPKEVLRAIEKDLGSFAYASQFRQNPVPVGGNMFQAEKFTVVSQAPLRFVRVVRYWDKAGTKGRGAYTVGVKMGLDLFGNFWVMDVVRVQMDSYSRETLIRDTAERDGPQVQIGMEQEPGSGGKDSALDSVKGLAGFRVKLFKVGASEGSKEMRAEPFSVQTNAGHCYLVKAPWNKEWLEEYRYFPASKYKDQVDAGAGAFLMCAERKVRVGGLLSKYRKETGIAV